MRGLGCHMICHLSVFDWSWKKDKKGGTLLFKITYPWWNFLRSMCPLQQGGILCLCNARRNLYCTKSRYQGPEVIILVTPPFGSAHLTGTGTGRNQQVVFLFPLRHTGQNHPSARLEQGIFCLKPTLVSSSSSYSSVIKIRILDIFLLGEVIKSIRWKSLWKVKVCNN